MGPSILTAGFGGLGLAWPKGEIPLVAGIEIDAARIFVKPLAHRRVVHEIDAATGQSG